MKKTAIYPSETYQKIKKYKGNNLYLILDLNTTHWTKVDSKGFDDLMVLISLIMNTHLVKSINNSVHVILMNSRDSKLIFPMSERVESETLDQQRIDNMDYQSIQTRIRKRIIDFMQKSIADKVQYSRLIQALTQTICRVNKFQQELEKKIISSGDHEKYYSSILILQASQIHSSSYNNLMSCVEAAIKSNVTVHVLGLAYSKFTDSTKNYLMQLCSLTSGYFPIFNEEKSTKSPFEIISYVSMLMLTSGDMIQKQDKHAKHNHPTFRHAGYENLEFIVNCACHNTPIQSNIAFVCSNCLFLYCKNEEICSFCETKLSIKKEEINQ